MTKVAITGADGFLGSAIVNRLRFRDGFEVRGYPFRGLGGVDIRDRRALKTAFAEFRPEFVVNAAGLAHASVAGDLSDLFAVNAYGAENVVHEAAKAGAKRVIHLGSVMVYGNRNDRPATEECEPNAEDDYGRSKLLGDEAASDAAREGGIGLSILRLCMIPSSKNESNLADLVRAIWSRRFLWVGDGANRKSVLTLSDAVRALECVLNHSSLDGVRIFNLCSGTPTMHEIVGAVEQGLQVSVPGLRIPPAFAGVASSLFGGHMGIPDQSRLRKFLSSDIISGQAIVSTLGFRYEGSVLEEIRRMASEFRRT